MTAAPSVVIIGKYLTDEPMKMISVGPNKNNPTLSRYSNGYPQKWFKTENKVYLSLRNAATEEDYVLARQKFNEYAMNNPIDAVILCGNDMASLVTKFSLHHVKGTITHFDTHLCLLTHNSAEIAESRDNEIGFRAHFDYKRFRAFLQRPDKIETKIHFMRQANMDPIVDIVNTEEKLINLFNLLKNEKRVVLDIETQSLWPDSSMFEKRPHNIYCIGFLFPADRFNRKVYVLPIKNHWCKEDMIKILTALGKWYSMDTDQIRIAHNFGFEQFYLSGICGMMYKKTQSCYIKPAGIWHDTMLMSYVLSETPGTNNLATSSFINIGAESWKQEGFPRGGIVAAIAKGREYETTIFKYNAKDVYYTSLLFGYFKTIMTEQERKLYGRTVLPMGRALAQCRRVGFPIDVDELEQQHVGIKNKMDKLWKFLCKTTELENPNSTQQLGRYFVKEGYNLPKTEKGNISVSAGTLEELVNAGDPVAKKILRYRSLAKMESTYINGMRPAILRRSKRVHASFNPVGTVTGRPSSSDPNLFNIPKRDADQKKLRKMFIAPKNHSIISIDFGQLEARLFSVICGDKQYYKDLVSGYDIHSEGGLFLLKASGQAKDMTEDEITEKVKSLRDGMKGCNFGLFYGATVGTAALSAGFDDRFVKLWRDRIFMRYNKIHKWQNDIYDEYKSHGFLTTPFGRKRHAPIYFNERLNFKNQSTGSDMTASVMNLVYKKVETSLFIYDDLNFFVPNKWDRDEFINTMINAFLSVPWVHMHKSKYCRMWCPMQVSVSIGDNWLDMEEIRKEDSITMGMNSLEDTLTVAKETIKKINSMKDIYR